MKCLIKSLASQRPRDNAVSSFIVHTGICINYYTYNIYDSFRKGLYLLG